MSYVSTELPRDIICAVETYRLAGDPGKETYSATASGKFTGGITPLTLHKRALLGGSLSLQSMLFCDDNADINEGDKVLVTFKGVQTEYRAFHMDNFQFGGHPHKEIVLSKVES